MYRRMQHRSAVQLVPMGLLLGGAIGNLHDRVRFGEVTDFIQVGVAGHYWPVFNVADSAITVGVSLLVLTLFRASLPHHPSLSSDSDAAGAQPGGTGSAAAPVDPDARER
jgi:lipoprotein signal peptidase